jgi:hypothetical protein
MTFEEIDKLVETETDIHFHGTERRDYRELEANDPVMFKGYGDRNGLMYLMEHGGYYIDINILKDSVKFKYRDGWDEGLIRTEFSFDDFTPQHIDMFIDLINEHVSIISEWCFRVEKFSKNNLPKEYIRAGKLNEITKI